MLRMLVGLTAFFVAAGPTPAMAVEAVRFTISGKDGPTATWRLPKNFVPDSGSGEEFGEYRAFRTGVDALVFGRWSPIEINSVVFFEELTALSIWQDGVRISIAYVYREREYPGQIVDHRFWTGPGSNPTFRTGTYLFGWNSGGNSIGGWLTITDTAIPEPATWAMLIAGFGIVGVAARRRRISVTRA